MDSEEQSSLSVSELSRILGRIHAQGAFETDPSRMRYRASEVRTKLAKLNDEAASLRQELLVLESFLAELSKKEPTPKSSGKVKANPSTQTNPTTAPARSVPGVGSPLGHRPKTPQLSPKKRAERAEKVLVAARNVVKRDGPQVTAASVAQQLIETNVDMGVPPDRMVTAVGNIIFRAKNEFEWVQNGLYRYVGKPINGQHRV